MTGGAASPSADALDTSRAQVAEVLERTGDDLPARERHADFQGLIADLVTGFINLAASDLETALGTALARIAEFAFEHLDAPIKRVASLDTPVPHAPQLEDAFMPMPDDIERAIREVAAY